MKSNKKEIIWNVINSCLAGSLVFLGSIINGDITFKSVIVALIACFIVAITKFRDYWAKEEKEYSSKIFSFLR